MKVRNLNLKIPIIAGIGSHGNRYMFLFNYRKLMILNLNSPKNGNTNCLVKIEYNFLSIFKQHSLRKAFSSIKAIKIRYGTSNKMRSHYCSNAIGVKYP